MEEGDLGSFQMTQGLSINLLLSNLGGIKNSYVEHWIIFS